MKEGGHRRLRGRRRVSDGARRSRSRPPQRALPVAGASSTRSAFASRRRRASSGCAWTSPSAAAGPSAARTSRPSWPRRGCAATGARSRPTCTSLARPAPFENDRLGRGVRRPAARSARSIRAPSSSSTSPATGPIRLPPGEGPRRRPLLFLGHTGQIVKRAALGRRGLRARPLQPRRDREAPARGRRQAAGRRRARRRPRDLLRQPRGLRRPTGPPTCSQQFHAAPRLRPAPAAADARLRRRRALAARCGATIGRTLTELYEERFLSPLRSGRAKNKVLLRIQNYGEPPASLASSRHADLIDGEGLALPHAHVVALGLVGVAPASAGRSTASETWTWLHSPAFRATPLDVKAEADQHFLSGINQLIGHGWPYSPPQAGNPGWPFYAAARAHRQEPVVARDARPAAYLQRALRSCCARASRSPTSRSTRRPRTRAPP